MRRLVILLITLYQKTLSPDHSWRRQRHPQGWCRYYPSCSEYTKQAVERHGVVRGLAMGSGRLLRCHPWAEPRVDLVK
jgi:uncharacterized protein